MKRLLFVLLWGCFSLIAYSQIVDTKYEQGKTGFVDAKGNWVVRPIYEKAHWDKEGKIGKAGTNDNLALIDEKGKFFTSFKYSNAYHDKDINLIKIEQKKNNKKLFGYCDRKGKELIPCEYENIYPYSGKEVDGYEPYVIYAMKDANGKKLEGVFDLQGKLIVPDKFENIVFSKYGMTVYDGKKYGIYGYDGRVLYDVIYANQISLTQYNEYVNLNIGGTVTENNKTFALGGKWGLGNREGNILVPCQYEEVRKASDHIFLVNVGGQRVKDEQYGLYAKIIGGKWGYYANGKEIIPCQYDQASPFKNGVATVKKDGQAILIKNPLEDSGNILIAQGTIQATRERNPNAPAVSRYPAPNSDVDSDIPVSSAKNDHKFAFIIANENYQEAPVPYALNDGRIFKEYCIKTLGMQEDHVRLYEDATFGNIIAAVETIREIADVYEGEAEVVFFYAGHGVPDDKKNTAYLLPVDGLSSDVVTTGYSLEKLYKEFSEMKLKSITVFLDACFSGSKREDQMLTSARGVAIKVKDEIPQGNMVVFSAATGDETAHQMENKGHGLFTYFLLKKLQETGGAVTLGDLTEYVTRQVRRQSVVINNKRQTPTVIPSPAVVTTWQNKSLK